MRSLALAAAAVATAIGSFDLSRRPRLELPDRLSSNKSSPFYDANIFRKVGVRFNGVDRPKDVIEHNRSEGWIIIHLFDLDGRPLRNKNGTWKTKRLLGDVEPYWKGLAPTVPVVVAELPAEHFQSAAEAKRARKAANLLKQAEKGAIARIVGEKLPAAEPAVVDESHAIKVRKPRAKKAVSA